MSWCPIVHETIGTQVGRMLNHGFSSTYCVPLVDVTKGIDENMVVTQKCRSH